MIGHTQRGAFPRLEPAAGHELNRVVIAPGKYFERDGPGEGVVALGDGCGVLFEQGQPFRRRGAGGGEELIQFEEVQGMGIRQRTARSRLAMALSRALPLFW